MSRPLRIDYEGAWHHVINRGRGHQAIFPGEAGYEAFLETLAETERLAVSPSIRRNPLDAPWPLVEDLANWACSSYPAYINRAKGPDWLRTEPPIPCWASGTGTRDTHTSWKPGWKTK